MIFLLSLSITFEIREPRKGTETNLPVCAFPLPSFQLKIRELRKGTETFFDAVNVVDFDLK